MILVFLFLRYSEFLYLDVGIVLWVTRVVGLIFLETIIIFSILILILLLSTIKLKIENLKIGNNIPNKREI
jgi:hypothetical protein